MGGQNNLQPNWHPNFRIESALPDTRAIHTSFIAKAIVYTAVLILALFALLQEYQSKLLQKSIGNLEQQIQSATPANRALLQKSEQFRKLALHVKELQLFFKAPLIVHESIFELSSIKPEEITFTSLNLSELVFQVKRGRQIKNQVKHNLTIYGDVQDLTILTQFKRDLEESQLLNPSGYTVNIDETIEQRDAETGIIPFKLTISLQALGKDSK